MTLYSIVGEKNSVTITFFIIYTFEYLKLDMDCMGNWQPRSDN